MVKNNFNFQSALDNSFIYYKIEGRSVADSTQTTMMGVSARNRLFSKKLIEKYIEFSENFEGYSHFVIFDVPYAFNDAADSNRALPTELEISKSILQGIERARSIEKCMLKSDKKLFLLHFFSDFEKVELVPKYREELVKGIKCDKNLYDTLASSSRSNIVSNNRTWNENFLNFQLQEIPTSIYLYYDLGWLIDLYPGGNTPFFKKLENGDFSESLPLATKVAKNKTLCFVNIEKSEFTGSIRK
jgi:hypothetical protein